MIWLLAKVIIVPAAVVIAFDVAVTATIIESANVKFPNVKTGETVVAFFTSTLAPALLTVIKFGLPPKIATTPPLLVMLVVPISQKRIYV
jgi:hypothetical protein